MLQREAATFSPLHAINPKGVYREQPLSATLPISHVPNTMKSRVIKGHVVKGRAVAADGVPIHYDTYGLETHGKTAPTLVFVHGWCCDRTYWRAQINHFASTTAQLPYNVPYNVVALDLAGHGDSGTNRAAWTMPAFGQDVVAVIEQLGLRRTILIGHSMGGPVIVEAARQMPDRVIGLIGADTLLNPERQRTPDFIAAQLAPLQHDFAQGTRDMVRREMFVPTSDAAWAASIVEDMASAPPHVGIGAMTALLNHDDELHAGLHALRDKPFVLINADYHPTNLETTQRQGMTVELMSGVGHFVMQEDTATFNHLVEAAVRRMVGKCGVINN